MSLIRACAGMLPIFTFPALLLALQQPAPPSSAPQTGDPAFDTAAVVAWRQFDRLWVPETGLAKATFDYDKLTTWDIGSVIGGLHSARILGLLPETEYHARMCRTLETLITMPLFEDAVFHKLYDARTGEMVGRDEKVSSRGYAWSATDMGRILMWLGIIARTDSVHRELATRIVQRVKFDDLVRDGYLYGEDATAGRRRYRFQEGRIGYEQYAAHGFNLWGHDVANALDINTHSVPVVVYGVELPGDSRRLDRLTSEPFVLLGLELGWSDAEAAVARNVLKVQEERYRRTNIVTIVSEDAVGTPPHFFYYYCVYCSGRAFTVEIHEPGRRVSSPRWVSTKATFGWHALLPSEYTRLAMERIAPARASVGWSSGVMERSGGPTRAYDINTAVVILEAAAYRKLGRPIGTPAAAPVTTPAR